MQGSALTLVLAMTGGVVLPGASRAYAQGSGAAAAPAPAEKAKPTPEEVDAAARHFDSGADFFNKGNYGAARAEFDAAYNLSKFPALLFNLGKTAEKQGQIGDSIRYFEQYLESNPADAAEVRVRVEKLRQHPDAPKTSTVGAAINDVLVPPESKMPPVPALALLGAGAGLLIIGIGCGAGALGDARTLMNSNGKPYSEVAATFDRGKSLESAAIAFDVLGSLVLAGGAAWTGYWLYKRIKNKPAVAPTAVSFKGGLGFGLSGQF